MNDELNLGVRVRVSPPHAIKTSKTDGPNGASSRVPHERDDPLCDGEVRGGSLDYAMLEHRADGATSRASDPKAVS